jgi:hypothetical protein
MPDDLDCVVPVGLVDPYRQRGRHPNPLEEDHHLLDGPLLLPRGRDHPGALGAKARHLDQPTRLLLDHLQGGLAEVVDDPLGHLRADPLDQPRAEVTADSLNGGGQHRLVHLNLELAAVLGMARPPALQPQALAGLRPKQRTDHGQQVAGPPGSYPGHGVARLLVGVGDPLQHPIQRGRRRRPRFLHGSDCTAHTRPHRQPGCPSRASTFAFDPPQSGKLAKLRPSVPLGADPRVPGSWPLGSGGAHPMSS